MAIPVNLAMTGGEFCQFSDPGPNTAWMACHFSPWGDGLSNLPTTLPPGSLLILDDQNPFDGHDPGRIQEELEDVVLRLGCCGLLLDFQRQGVEEVQALASGLSLPCPVAVTALYANASSGPVFLPPLNCHVPLKKHLAPWQSRELWLELALDSEVIVLTKEGAKIGPGERREQGLEDKILHCHYTAAVEKEKAVFHLWRTKEDLAELIQEAEKLGIQRAVGLFQELHQKMPP